MERSKKDVSRPHKICFRTKTRAMKIELKVWLAKIQICDLNKMFALKVIFALNTNLMNLLYLVKIILVDENENQVNYLYIFC